MTVVFKPTASKKYQQTAYCNISCSDKRLPIVLEGEGLGPKAILSTNQLFINDVFVNDHQNYNIYIENKGEIPARFSLVKGESSSVSSIKFNIEEETLQVG